MAKSRRGSRRRTSQETDAEDAGGSGGFLGQVGLFETANGLPHGPGAVALAIVAAVLIFPIAKAVGMLRRR